MSRRTTSAPTLHPAAPVAVWIVCAGCGAVAATARTRPVGPIRHLGVHAEGGFGECHLGLDQDIATARPPPTSAGSERPTITEHRPQEVVEAAEPATEQIAQVDGVSPVVAGPAFGVAQDLVRLGRLAETLGGGGIVGIGIRVRVAGNDAECPLDVFGGSVALDAEHGVVVGGHHR